MPLFTSGKASYRQFSQTLARLNVIIIIKIASKDHPTFMHLDNREKVLQRQTNTNVVWKSFAQVIYYSQYEKNNNNEKRSCIPPQHAGTSWWSTENVCVYWLTMLISCFTVSMIWYRNIQRRVTCTPVLFIPAYIKSVAWLYVFTYAHIYISTYMHARIYIYIYILMVTDFMSTLWYYLPLIVYITLHVSVL